MPRRNENKGATYKKGKDVKIDAIDTELKNLIYFAQTNTYLFTWICNGVTIYNMKLIKGSNGWFISFPSREGNDGKWYNHVYVDFTEEEKKTIIDKVIESVSM